LRQAQQWQLALPSHFVDSAVVAVMVGRSVERASETSFFFAFLLFVIASSCSLIDGGL
jgi:hypothetical protein